ncbi:MAG: hypothetical protein A2W31_02760 [Planctomycetes bacterium RBG_16_64_10]|nr:MAG: hypothetical protein A2W31_02760 [Planctomycetes bacterium RBG_16_64_10]
MRVESAAPVSVRGVTASPPRAALWADRFSTLPHACWEEPIMRANTMDKLVAIGWVVLWAVLVFNDKQVLNPLIHQTSPVQLRFVGENEIPITLTVRAFWRVCAAERSGEHHGDLDCSRPAGAAGAGGTGGRDTASPLERVRIERVGQRS